jgi:3-oxoadipate enol-lactonase
VARWRLPSRYARSGGVRIAYEVRGRWRGRRPWLVLIQGLGFDRAGWAPVLADLRPHFRLVLIDNRGSGRSDRPVGSLTVSDMARDVISVLRAAGVRKAHVMGVSLGGMVAQEVAIEYPAYVDALILVATTPGWPFAYPMPAQSVAVLAAAASLPEEVALRRTVENALSPDTVRHRPALVRQLINHRRRYRTDPKGWYAQLAAGSRFAGNLRQSKIRARTLVVHGGADAVVDPRNAELLAARIDGARLVIVPRLGHLFFWEDPRRFVEVVLDFLLRGGRDGRRRRTRTRDADAAAALARGLRAGGPRGRRA